MEQRKQVICTPKYKYILPNRDEYFTEKTARKALGVGTTKLRGLVKIGTVQKILLTNTANSYDKTNNIQ
ncbi:hypothetical protein [Labilibaculum euxinus]|uniref:Uncharacterized protein n=1 Tax=Labilibaculum euxinus TaxID=2686357 RepID=A0A7M4D2E1_9BACT|nr:hypothetical protein [Labilibaculum euxinus]MUP36820.1 hypothetical protein [Labilibaculum euxinus]MVB06025.1 hypothetical protein [Labilibaculum euxinus]